MDIINKEKQNVRYLPYPKMNLDQWKRYIKMELLITKIKNKTV